MRSGTKVKVLTAGLAALAMAAAGCSSGSESTVAGTGSPAPATNSPAASSANNGGASTGGASGGTVSISNASGSLWNCGFNPFNPNDQGQSFGLVYEPLEFVNSLQSGRATPWLATASAWSNDSKTLTFTIRSGVKWSDGQPFSAADVAYTFNLLKSHKALDLDAVWSVLSSVTQQGDKVVIDFKQPATSFFYFLADQTPIVPAHIWKSLPDPVTYTDPKPVGTGPFVLSKCTPQNIAYTKNPSYWQPGLPKITSVQYPAYTSNDPANLALSTGKANWGGQFIPNIDKFYTSKSSNYHYWFPPVSNVALYMNNKVAPLDNVKVRQALAYAIDRQQVTQIGQSGESPAANQTGIVTPTFKSWLDSSAAAKFDYTYDPAKAGQLLTEAGYHKGGNGMFVDSSGKPLAFSVINVGGFSNRVAALQVIQQEFKKVGIALTVDNMSGNDFNNDLFTGKYQLAYESDESGPTPYYEFYGLLFSQNSAPIGQSAASNYERYSNPATDKLLEQYASTTDSATQHHIIDQLQQVMLTDVPVIPVYENVDYYEYDTSDLTGWVTQQDPYAQPAPYRLPDWEVVLLHLHAK